MVYYVTRRVCADVELYHHGVKGMKWGVRRVKTVANTASRAISAARYEEAMKKAVRRQKKATARFERRDARYKQRIEKLDKLYKTKVSDLSPKTIRNGQIAYKALKIVKTNVAYAGIGAAGGHAIVTAMKGVNLANTGASVAAKLLETKSVV